MAESLDLEARTLHHSFSTNLTARVGTKEWRDEWWKRRSGHPVSNPAHRGHPIPS